MVDIERWVGEGMHNREDRGHVQLVLNPKLYNPQFVVVVVVRIFFLIQISIQTMAACELDMYYG